MTPDMTSDATPDPAPEGASRREIIAAAATIAAVAGTAGGAQAQAPAVRFLNPPGMSNPPTYTHVIEVNGPHRTVYIAGQTGADASGKVGPNFRAQAVQVFENIKTALAGVGGGLEHVVKMTSFLTDIAANAGEFRDVRGQYFTNKNALPANTLVQISRLANPAYLLEVEAVAILPPKA